MKPVLYLPFRFRFAFTLLSHRYSRSISCSSRVLSGMPPRGITKTQKPAIKKKKATSRKAAALATMSAPSLSSDVVYFWRPQDNNGFMSQWYSSPFEHEGIKYATAEMWMMVQKAKLFKDEVNCPQCARMLWSDKTFVEHCSRNGRNRRPQSTQSFRPQSQQLRSENLE
jgi:hypothetical protein